MNENIKELIKYEYENGASIRVLAEKYGRKVGTIKSWVSREKWIKKKENIATVKHNRSKKVANYKDVQIQSDILDGKTKKEIMSKYGISERTYSRKTKNARQLRKEKTEKYLEQVAEEVYKGELYKVLKGTEMAKARLVVRTTNEINSQQMDAKKVHEYDKAYKTIKKMNNDLMRTGQMLTTYELLEVDKQLAEEALQQEKLEIEKSKIKKDDEKEIEKENEMIELLKNITKKVEKNE